MGLIAQYNAFSERINRTIKEEYLAHWDINSFSGLKRKVKQAVEHYNTKRIDNNIKRMIPQIFREYVVSLLEQDRPTVKIYTEVEDKIEGTSSSLNFKQDLAQVQNCPMSKIKILNEYLI